MYIWRCCYDYAVVHALACVQPGSLDAHSRRTSTVDDGRVFTGRQSLPLKLIDEVGTEDDAVRWLQTAKHVAVSVCQRFSLLCDDSFNEPGPVLLSKARKMKHGL